MMGSSFNFRTLGTETGESLSSRLAAPSQDSQVYTKKSCSPPPAAPPPQKKENKKKTLIICSSTCFQIQIVKKWNEISGLKSLLRE